MLIRAGIRAYPPEMACKTESLVRKYLREPNTLVSGTGCYGPEPHDNKLHVHW